MWVGRVDGCFFVVGPEFTAALSTGVHGPLGDCLFMVAKVIKHRSILDKDRLKRRSVAWDLMSQYLKMPLSKDLFESFLEVWA